jgi:hypothetical protein
MILHCSCGKKWSLKDNLARPGMKVACRSCQNPLFVPESDSSELEAARHRIEALEEANEALRSELSQAVEARILEIQRLHKAYALKELEPSSGEEEGHFHRDLNGFLSSWAGSILHLQERLGAISGAGEREEEVLIEDEVSPENDLEETVSDPQDGETNIRPSRKPGKR